jgi:hypothetical protein
MKISFTYKTSIIIYIYISFYALEGIFIIRFKKKKKLT